MSLFTLLLANGALTLHVIGILFALRAAARAPTAQGGVAWAISLTIFPYLALPAYALFGPPHFEDLAQGRAAARKAALSREHLKAAVEARADWSPLERLAALPTMQGPPPKLLIDGDATFEAVFQAIDGAQRYILAQFYIIRDDGLGQRFKDRLIARARDGLRVCLLYDRIGAHGVPRRYWEDLRAGGVEVRPFEVIGGIARLTRLNFRNHRKVVVADGSVAICGGPNVGDEYLGLDHYFGHWRDTAVRLTGPAAVAAEASFLEDWLWAGGMPLMKRPLLPDRPAEANSVPSLVLPTGPADPLPACTLFLSHLIAEARERVWIASPYFVPDLDIMTILKLAALRGVDVRILIPERPDHQIVWLAAFAYAEETLRSGITLHRYNQGFMHQKIILIDDRIAGVGTVNLDNRSLHLNFEVTVLTFDQGFAREVAAMLEDDFARSRLYDEAAYARRGTLVRVLAPAARLAAPLL